MEQKRLRSDEPFMPSPFVSVLPQSSSFPWKFHPPLQLSSVTGSALPTWKHFNTQRSPFTFRSFTTAQFKSVQSPEQAHLCFSRCFFKMANLKFKKKKQTTSLFLFANLLSFTELRRSLFLYTNKPNLATPAPCQRTPTTSPLPDRAEMMLSQGQPYDCPVRGVVVLLFNREKVWESTQSMYCRPFLFSR